MKTYRRTLLGIVLITLGVSFPAQAGPIFEVGLRNNVFGNFQLSSSATAPHTDSFTTNYNHTNASAGVDGPLTADAGVLSNQLTHNLEFQSLAFGINGSADSISTFEFDDLIFFDVNNPAATGNIQVRSTAFFSGTMDENWFAEGVGNTQRVIGATYFLRIRIGEQQFDHSLSLDAEGDFSGSFTTDFVTVPLNVPTKFFGVTKFFTRTLLSFPDNQSGGFVRVESATEYSLAEVFDLPGGFSVNSTDGGITNNQIGTAAVPEPSTLALLFTGSLCLIGFSRRRKHAA